MLKIFRTTKFLVNFIILSFCIISVVNASEKKVDLKLESSSSGCDFLFQSYFSQFISNQNNSKIFRLDKTIPGVLLSKTDNLDLTAQVTVKKGKAPKSPTLTLFFALEKNKKLGNYIIPDARQKLCKGKFKLLNSKHKLAKSKETSIKKKIAKPNIKTNKEKLNIDFLKTGGFFSGKYNYNAIEKITVSEKFPTHTARGYEVCTSTKSKWNTTLNFYLDKNLFWATMFHSKGSNLRLYLGVRKADKIIFKIFEGATEWKDTTNWLSGYSLDLKNKSLEQALSQTMKGNYFETSGGYRRECKLVFDRVIRNRNLNDQLSKLSALVRQQKITLNRMNKFGLLFKQKYDFEKAEYIVERLYKIEKLKLQEIKAKELVELREKKLAEEKEKKLAKEKARRIAEQKARKKAEEKEKKLAEEKARRIAEQKARKKAEEKARKLTEEKEKLQAELKASKLAEEKKRKKADEEAKKIANEKKLKAAEEKAKKAAEEKAKKLAEISKKRIDDNIKFVRGIIDGTKRLKGLFDAMENKIKKDSRFPDLAKLHKEFYLIVEKPVDEMSYSEITTFINLYTEYFKLRHQIYKDYEKKGVFKIKNEYVDYNDEVRKNLKNEFDEINRNLKQFENIGDSFRKKYPKEAEKFSESLEIYLSEKFGNDFDYDFFSKIKTLSNSLNKPGRSYWTDFFYNASYHVKISKKYDEYIKNWIKFDSGKFKSYYNKEIYNISVKESIKDIEKKQKEEESFFDKLGN